MLFIHRRLKRMVGSYVDGELTRVRAAAVAAHLRRCAGCSEEATFITLVKCSLRRRTGGVG
ncbi:MAG: zf-HC2 domain-containing protein [Acidimicrobiales bacterium]